jgi:hypothetical protein
MKKIVCAFALLILWVGLTRQGVVAQETQPNNSTTIKNLEEQIKEEEKKLKELQEEVLKLEQNQKQSQPTKSVVEVSKGVDVKLIGFIRGDAFSDSHQTNFAEAPSYVLSPNAPQFKNQSVGAFSMTARYTRIGVEVSGHSLPGGWNPTGLFDFDFANALSFPGTSNPDVSSRSKPAPRLHLGYVRIENKSGYFFEMGQDWDLLGSVLPIVDVVPTNMGNVGDVGYRRPQIQLGYMPSLGLQAALEIGSPGAVDNAILDNTGFISGESSQMPFLSILLGYNWESGLPSHPNSIRIWGGEEEQKLAGVTLAGKSVFHTEIMGMDFVFPFNNIIMLHGKIWTGKDLSDLTGGIGQNINPTTGEEIASRGGWIEFGLNVAPNYSIYPGYFLDNPFSGDLTLPFARTKNSAWTLAQRWILSKELTMGLDYFYWVTNYKAEPPGIDNRFNLFLQEGF